MRRLRVLTSVVAVVLTSAPLAVIAATQRTFVASTGLDTNPCSVTQPCRTFTAAIAQTNPSGEVIALDSAGYGPFSISKAISIIAPPGVYAGISVPSGPGINVSAGANDVVVLRGLSINGQGGVDGIVVNSAKEVHIENCTISNMTHEGVYIPGGGYTRIAGSTLRSNALSGVFVPTSNTTKLTIDDTQSVRNGQAGFFIQGSTRATILNSRATDNVSDGLLYQANAGTPAIAITGGEYSGNQGGGVRLDATNQAFGSLSIHGASVSRNFGHGLSIQSVSNPPASGVNASISGSHITWNGGNGLWTGSIFSANINLIVVSHSMISENGVVGVLANGAPGTIVNVSANTATRNADFDFSQSNAGTLNTFVSNALTGGGSDVNGSLTSKSLR